MKFIRDKVIVHSNDNNVTVHNVAAFNSDDLTTSRDALSIRNMNIADVAAAAILHKSPAVIVAVVFRLTSLLTFCSAAAVATKSNWPR